MRVGGHEALPTRRVRWGAGALSLLPAELERLGATRAALLTARSLAGTLAPVVERTLGDLAAGRLTGLTAHVPAAAVAAVAEQIQTLRVDSVVTLGGGSVIDGAKAVSARLAGLGQPRPLHVALPTTLSGAEYAHYYGVTADGAKTSFSDRAGVPAIVILDPALTAATPAPLWSGSGVKALDHAIETILALGHRPIADVVALAGLRGLAANLVASGERDTTEARLDCQVAAWQCYFAPANATLGLSHRLGHVLGGSFGVPHALTSGITLPAVMRAMDGTRPGAMAAIARALSDGTGAADALDRLVDALGLPRRLRDVGIERRDLPRIVGLVADRHPAATVVLGDRPDEALRDLVAAIW